VARARAAQVEFLEPPRSGPGRAAPAAPNVAYARSSAMRSADSAAFTCSWRRAVVAGFRRHHRFEKIGHRQPSCRPRRAGDAGTERPVYDLQEQAPKSADEVRRSRGARGRPPARAR